MLRYLAICLFAAGFCLASDPSAVALARAARKAQDHGQVVRAYLLYAEAAARDPNNESYRRNREALKPLANLLSKAKIEEEPSRADLLASVSDDSEQPLEPLEPAERNKDRDLQPPPKLQFSEEIHDFHLRNNERSVIETVARAYQVEVVFDPEFQPQPRVQLDLNQASFREAMGALTDATDTFVFPISPRAIFVARDTSQKRDQYEPQVTFTVPLSEATDPKDVTEAANAARQVFELKHIAMDTDKRSIVVRDRVSRARPAQVLLESIIHPKPQVSLEVEILSVDSKSSLRYGVSLPNSFAVVNFTRLGIAQSFLNLPQGVTNFLTFGGGRTLFGIGITEAQAFAMASQSRTQSLFDILTVVSDGQTTNLHIGDKFPIAQALYTGVSQLPSALYAPPPQIEQIDLGILLKMTPRLHANGDISLDIEASYKALGTETLNTVPEILQRELKGTVQLGPGQWAVLGGLETQTTTITRNGLAAITDIPVVSTLLGRYQPQSREVTNSAAD